MTNAFLFLLARSWKNRVLERLRRLRRPRYLVSVLAGIAYLATLIFYRPYLQNAAPHGAPDPALQALIQTLFALMLLGVLFFQWFFLDTRTPLFTEAEVLFLYPAPVPRTTLLHYRIAKAQAGIVFGALISAVIFGASRLFPNPVFLALGAWLAYSFLFLFRMAALMTRQGWQRAGARGRRRGSVVLGLVLLAAAAIAVSARWFYPPLPPPATVTVEALGAWFRTVTETGPVSWALFPFRALVRPAFASSIAEFAAAAGLVLCAIAALYVVIRRADAGFEEAALGAPPEEPAPAGKRGGAVQTPRRPPFQLAPEGFAPVALYWKNLSLLGGMSLREMLPAAAGLAVFAVAVLTLSGQLAPLLVGSVAGAMALTMTLMGPVIFRDDLRTDLVNVDLLKSYPVPGWGIVLGEVLGPATIIALIQWLMIALAAALLPGFHDSWKLSDRVYMALGAALILPCLSVIGVLVQNAAVLLLPGWMQLGREHQRGVEAMGQRLIAGIATALSLAIAAVPAGLMFLLMWLVGYWLIGMAILPAAALLAAFVLLGEAALGVLWLGRVFDRFDPA